MDLWDQDFVDEEVEVCFEFGSHNIGSFQFGYVQGQIDYRVGTCDGKPCVEFAWVGNNESDSAQGRGWATLEGDEITGMICLYPGDESAFKRKKSKR